MDFRSEVREIKRRFLIWLAVFISLVVFLCTAPFTLTTVGPISLPSINGESGKSLVASIFIDAKQELLPASVDVIATSPLAVFLIQIKIALLVAFILVMPVTILLITSYLRPALEVEEHRAIRLFLGVTLFLFAGGMIFAYQYLIPPVFSVLLSFNVMLEVVPYLSVEEFVGWTLAIMMTAGALFLLPIAMTLATALGFVRTVFWLRHWREIFLCFIVIAALVTPDMSGISVVLLLLPMVMLYFLGILASRYFERKRVNKLS